MSIYVYGISNCNTVQKSLYWLKAHHIEFEWRDFKKTPPTKAEIMQWLQTFSWEELLNRKGTTYKKIPEANRPTNEQEAIELMILKPSSIKRPLLLNSDQKVFGIGFTEADYQQWFKNPKL
jgi:arsenate reductase